MPTAVHLSTVHSATDHRIFHKELRTLVEAGYNVQYFVHHAQDETRNGVRIRSLGTISSRAERWKHLSKIYYEACACNADLYHLHDPELLPVGVALSNRTGGKVVYDAHEDYGSVAQTRTWIPENLRPALVEIVPRIEATLARRLDATVAATEWVGTSLRARGVSPVTVLNNFPKIQDIEVPEQNRRTSSDHSLVYVGSLTRARGVNDMVELVNILSDMGRDVSLEVVGPFGDSQVEQEIRTFVETNGLEDVVTFVGPVEHKDVFGYLSTADIGLALLEKEPHEGTIPTKIFEYMYSRLPFLMTAIEPLASSRYFSPKWGRIVPEGNTRAQAEAVCELLDDPEQRATMGNAGRKAVEEQYCWEREEGKLLDLYDELL